MKVKYNNSFTTQRPTKRMRVYTRKVGFKPKNTNRGKVTLEEKI